MTELGETGRGEEGGVDTIFEGVGKGVLFGFLILSYILVSKGAFL